MSLYGELSLGNLISFRQKYEGEKKRDLGNVKKREKKEIPRTLIFFFYLSIDKKSA